MSLSERNILGTLGEVNESVTCTIVLLLSIGAGVWNNVDISTIVVVVGWRVH